MAGVFSWIVWTVLGVFVAAFVHTPKQPEQDLGAKADPLYRVCSEDKVATKSLPLVVFFGRAFLLESFGIRKSASGPSFSDSARRAGHFALDLAF